MLWCVYMSPVNVIGPFFATQQDGRLLWPAGYRFFVFDAGRWEEVGAPMVLDLPRS
jgi:hypothetical protein